MPSEWGGKRNGAGRKRTRYVVHVDPAYVAALEEWRRAARWGEYTPQAALDYATRRGIDLLIEEDIRAS